MDDKKCAEYAEYILENNGLSKNTPSEILKHVKACPECRLKVELFRTGSEQIEAPAYQIDSSLLRAQETAAGIIKRRKDILNFILFIITALSISTIIASAGRLGIVIPVLLVQGVMLFLMPAIFLVIFIKSSQKQKKGAGNE